MATHRRRMPAAERREVILAAAEDTFAAFGYHRASLDEIAHSAGISKALIYEHFQSKRELHASLLHHHAADIFERLKSSVEHGETGEERLRSGIDAFLGFVEEHRGAWRALFRDAAEPDVAEMIGGLQRQATSVIARLIAAGPEAGGAGSAAAGEAERAMHVEIHAQLLSGAVQSLATWWNAHPDVPRRALVDRAIEFCWYGLDRLPERRPSIGSAG